MAVASYKSNEDVYELVRASMEDVEEDMAFALQDVVEVDVEYKSRMEESVRQELGFRVLKNGIRIGVMYNAVIDGEYTGCSIYCKDDRVGMMVILKSMFEVYDWYKIVVMPHEGGLKYFVSMASTASIIKYHAVGTPIEIIKSDIVPLGVKAFKYLGIEEL